MTVKWAVGQYLDRHGITPYKLWKVTGLAKNTVYAIAQGKGDRVDFDTLGALVGGLETLTGKRPHLDDLLEVVPN
jgi:DNA-binding Xre family transcriptional regulator